jgi:hypothetical protein
LEQTAGELAPHHALQIADGMIRDRRILTLEGGRMTTLAIRAQEQAIERRTTSLARPAGRRFVDATSRLSPTNSFISWLTTDEAGVFALLFTPHPARPSPQDPQKHETRSTERVSLHRTVWD